MSEWHKVVLWKKQKNFSHCNATALSTSLCWRVSFCISLWSQSGFGQLAQRDLARFLLKPWKMCFSDFPSSRFLQSKLVLTTGCNYCHFCRHHHLFLQRGPFPYCIKGVLVSLQCMHLPMCPLRSMNWIVSWALERKCSQNRAAPLLAFHLQNACLTLWTDEF